MKAQFVFCTAAANATEQQVQAHLLALGHTLTQATVYAKVAGQIGGFISCFAGARAIGERVPGGRTRKKRGLEDTDPSHYSQRHSFRAIAALKSAGVLESIEIGDEPPPQATQRLPVSSVVRQLIGQFRDKCEQVRQAVHGAIAAKRRKKEERKRAEQREQRRAGAEYRKGLAAAGIHEPATVGDLLGRAVGAATQKVSRPRPMSAEEIETEMDRRAAVAALQDGIPWTGPNEPPG